MLKSVPVLNSHLNNEEGRIELELLQLPVVRLQPKTKVLGKVSKTLKHDTIFAFQLNLRHAQRFVEPPLPKSTVEDVNTKYSAS